jgi:predicted alpha-1,6-mannanase (GH76 family)
MKKSWIIPLFALLLVPCICTCGGDSGKPPKAPGSAPGVDWNAAADSSSKALVSAFWDEAEHYFWTNNYGNKGFQYWPQAHALDVLIDAYERSGNAFYKAYFGLWFNGVKKMNGKGWYNSYFDDMEWIALALLRVYKVTGEERYKAATLELWKYIVEGWNDFAGGGIAWERNNNVWSKNACSNGPACILAARLYRETGEEAYRNWAIKIYEWERKTLYNTGIGVVYDNINGQTGEKNTTWNFTYNQGTFVGSGVELHQITGEKKYLDDAVLTANYTLNRMVTDGVLRDEGNGDGGLFKGIFIRYFTELIRQEQLESDVREGYAQFLRHNAETLWTKGTNKAKVLFSPSWSKKPGATAGLTEQTSGCMLIEAMNIMNRE